MSTFTPFGLMHAVTFAACVLATAAVCIVGLRLRRVGREHTWRHALGWSGMALAVVHQAWWMLPWRFTWHESLPLHVCDLNGFVAAAALLTEKRWLRALLYFWGIGLSSQGLIQPVLQEGPATLRFWFFWVSHAVIVGFAVYDLVVARYRPSWRDLVFVVIVSTAYFGAMVALNAVTGWNYGYVGNVVPENPTLIDKLGPWPQRVFMLYGIGIAGFVVMWAPWWVFGTRHRVRRTGIEVKGVPPTKVT